MKKILCLILCLISIVSCCSMTISAATEEVAPSVEGELAGMTMDGKLFNEADYPVNAEDPNKYILIGWETGFKNLSSSPDFNLFVYVYNPNCEKLRNTDEISVQIGVNMHADNYYFYKLGFMSASQDNRFIKYKVRSRGDVNVDTLYMNQDKPNERVYNFVTLRLNVGGVLKSFDAKKSFLFTGYDFDKSKKAQSADLYGIDVEMFATNWISQNAGFEGATIYDHYEIASMYFTLPKSLFDEGTGYDYIESIRADFMRYQCTPIIVTRPDVFDKTTSDAIEYGTLISPGCGIDVMDLFWSRYPNSVEFQNAQQFYTESKFLYDRYNKYSMSTYYNSLAYYFTSDKIPENFDWDDSTAQVVAVPAEKLEAYFYERYNDPNYANSKLFTSEEHLIVDYNSADLGEDYLYEMSTFTQNKTSFEKWFYEFLYKDESYLFQTFPNACNKIDIITDPSKYINVSDANAKSVADELFIGVNDVEKFSGICNKADLNDEYVVLLRFGFSDYTCMPVFDVWESDLGRSGPVAFAIDKVFYRSVNLLQIVFSKDEQSIVVPVCSNTVDAFGDLSVFDPDITDNPFADDADWKKDLEELWEKLQKILKILALCLLLIVLAPVIFFFVRWIFKISRGSANSIKRQIRKDKDDNNGKGG